MAHWRVRLPSEVAPPFQVFVNGVRQQAGVDYEARGRLLLFDRPLAKEQKLGFWRWLIGAFGVGTYRQNDAVDVTYELGGRAMVVHALEIEPPDREG